MKIRTENDAPTKKKLQSVLEREFPDYQYRIFGLSLLVNQSLTRGVAIKVSGKTITVGSMLASWSALFLAAALFALFILPGIIYLIILMNASRPLVEEIGGFLEEKYGE